MLNTVSGDLQEKHWDLIFGPYHPGLHQSEDLIDSNIETHRLWFFWCWSLSHTVYTHTHTERDMVNFPFSQYSVFTLHYLVNEVERLLSTPTLLFWFLSLFFLPLLLGSYSSSQSLIWTFHFSLHLFPIHSLPPLLSLTLHLSPFTK